MSIEIIQNKQHFIDFERRKSILCWTKYESLYLHVTYVFMITYISVPNNVLLGGKHLKGQCF